MEMIAANGYDIKIGEINVCGLNNYLKENYAGVKKYIMLDGNTLKHCFPYIAQHCPELNGAEIIELESGEQHKTIETCMGVWQALSELLQTQRLYILMVTFYAHYQVKSLIVDWLNVLSTD